MPVVDWEVTLPAVHSSRFSYEDPAYANNLILQGQGSSLPPRPREGVNPQAEGDPSL